MVLGTLPASQPGGPLQQGMCCPPHPGLCPSHLELPCALYMHAHTCTHTRTHTLTHTHACLRAQVSVEQQALDSSGFLAAHNTLSSGGSVRNEDDLLLSLQLGQLGLEASGSSSCGTQATTSTHPQSPVGGAINSAPSHYSRWAC